MFRRILAVFFVTGTFVPGWDTSSALAQCEQPKLIAGEVSGGDYFGRHIAVHDDRALIGAYGDDHAGSQSGAAYIFHREGEAWIQDAKLTAGDTVGGDQFGYTVSIWNDYALVGAVADQTGGLMCGSAYVFVNSNGTWVQQAKLLAADLGHGDLFGVYVAIEDHHAVVGADSDDTPLYDAGSAYVYVRDDNGTPSNPTDDTWTQQAKLTASDAEETNLFGRSVGISGDYIVVGVYNDNDYGTASGSAYIFRRDDNGTPEDHSDDAWVEQAKLHADDAWATAQFGVGVAICGDYVVIGAHHHDGVGTDSGAAYLFRRDDNGTPANPDDDTWAQQAKLTPADTQANDWFGRFVSISGDDVLVGAYGDDDAGDQSGSAYFFRRDDNGTPEDPSDDTWPEQVKLTASDGAAGDWFGYSVATDGGYALVGAKWDDDAGVDAGSVYVYDVLGGYDCDSNGINDACEVDCNTNGILDVCDIAGSTSEDCDANGVPDECESIGVGFDGDGDIDFSDFSRFQACFTGPGPTALGAGCCLYDFEPDDDVDLDDFAVLHAALSGPL